MIKTKVFAILGILFIAVSCGNETKPDISKINLTIQVKRFDLDLFSGNLDSLPSQISWFRKEYGEFFEIFNYKIINVGGDNEPGYPKLLRTYLTDFSVNQWYNRCKKIFPDIKFLETGLTQAFRYYTYYFPEKSVPEVVSFVGGLNQSVVTSDHYLGVALDKYLGKDCDLYLEVNPPVPAYLRSRMYKGKMVSDCMKGWLLTEFEKSDTARNLLQNLIYQGKILYLLKCIIPEESDSVLMGYDVKQIKWLERNEKKMWTYIVENKFLFSTDQTMIRKFIDEAPFTREFSRESPGQAGCWIGYRIVKSYMKKSKNTSLKELMQDSDCLKILELSRYDP
jgi:hypothetical protein